MLLVLCFTWMFFTEDISISCRDTTFLRMWNRNKVVWWQKCLCRNVFIRMLWLCGGGGALLLCRDMCSLLFPDYLRHTVICAQLLCSRALLHIISAITARMYFNIILLIQFVEADLCGFVQKYIEYVLCFPHPSQYTILFIFQYHQIFTCHRTFELINKTRFTT